MSDFTITYIKQPADDDTNSSRQIMPGATIKEAFWHNNLCINV